MWQAVESTNVALIALERLLCWGNRYETSSVPKESKEPLPETRAYYLADHDVIPPTA